MTGRQMKLFSLFTFSALFLSFIAFAISFIFHRVPMLKGTILFGTLFMCLFILSIFIWIGYALLVKEHYVRVQLVLLFVWLMLLTFWEYYLMTHYWLLFIAGLIMCIWSLRLFIKATFVSV
jgi:hypothetical protein